jgi:hypothetical protein
MRSPVCLPTLVTFEPTDSFHKIQQRGHALEGDLGTIILNSIASTILKLQRFRLLRWIENLHQPAWDYQRLTRNKW